MEKYGIDSIMVLQLTEVLEKSFTNRLTVVVPLAEDFLNSSITKLFVSISHAMWGRNPL
jgi:hypothetical protein